MDFFDENFIVEDASRNKLEEKVATKTEKEEVATLEEETLLMNSTTVRRNIVEFSKAKRRNDVDSMYILREEFKKVLDCLGDDNRESLENKQKEIKSSIEKDGASALNIAKLKNTNAKLDIIEYKEKMQEYVGNKEDLVRNMKNDNNYSNNKDRKLSKALLVGVIGAAGIIALSAMVKSCAKNKDNTISTGNTTTTVTGSISDEPTTTETIQVTTSTGDYSVETVDPNYSSPTRQTTDEEESKNNENNNNKNNNKKGKKGVEPGATTKHLRPTSPKNKKITISKATSPSHKKPTEKGTYNTDVNGTEAKHTQPKVKPTGNSGKLPVEPTKVTVNRKATTKPTSKPTAKPTKKPVQTVDPNDPNNVVEKKQAAAKVLSLSLWR